MTTKKQQLIENTIIYTDSDNTNELSLGYNSQFNWFYLIFNGKHFTYKSYKSFENKCKYFISKYNLKPIEPTTITFIN